MRFRASLQRTGRWFLTFALLLLAGCGAAASSDKLDTVPGKGVVLLNGQPLTQGTITLSPKDVAEEDPLDPRRPAQSAIGTDGSFSLSTVTPGDGILPGDYLVAVVAMDNDGAADPRKLKDRPKSLIPEKYGDLNRSGLQLTIPYEGATDLKIELTK